MYKLTYHHMPGYVQWLVRWRWVVIIVCLLLVSVAASGLRYFETTADYRIYFGKDNPQLIAYETLEATYTKTDNIIFVIQPENQNVFTRETLAIVKQLTEDA